MNSFSALSLNQKIEHLKAAFEVRGWTLSLAESCTGGLISANFAAQAGISKIYLGGVVSYHKDLKTQVLGVDPSLIAVLGEVSEPVALQMARGIKSITKSTWALSVTGIAGPGGGTPDKPVGTVCFALVGPGFEETRRIQFAASDRQKIQFNSLEFALSFLWDSTHK